MNATPLTEASWIWKTADQPPHSDLYLCFRKTWQGTEAETEQGWVDISADSDFVLFLNGVEIGRGQFPDYPQRKTWSRFWTGPLLKRGLNVLAVLVFYRGEDFSEYAKGEGGLLVALQAGETRLVSDATWKYAPHSAFRSGEARRTTQQAGFEFAYDARQEEAWTTAEFDDGRWKNVTVTQELWQGPTWPQVRERPLPPLRVGAALPVRVAAQGRYVQIDHSSGAGVAGLMKGRALQALRPSELYDVPELCALPTTSGPARNPGEWLRPGAGPLAVTFDQRQADGWYLLIDLGAECVGLLTLEVEAPAGTVLEIAHGEHLGDGRVRTQIDDRFFADRYICGEGRRSFAMPFRRLGARYLELHGSAPVRLFHLSLLPVEANRRREGSFHTLDPLACRLQESAVRTLELCGHDHYEDCPWRERALYGFDARLQALFGYYTFRDYRFAETSLALLGESCGEDGFLALTAPGRRGAVIPVFSFHWICALAEHWLFSGRDDLFVRFESVIRNILEQALSRLNRQTGLYHLPEDAGYWNFYEWSPGLTGELPCPERHALYQLMLHSAGRAWHWMLITAGRADDPETAAASRWLAELKGAVRKQFFRDDAFSSFEPDGLGRHEFVQALAVLEGAAGNAAPVLASGVAQDLFVPAMLANRFFSLQAVAAAAPEQLTEMLARLEADWKKMMFAGATSLWETVHGADDFHGSGSLCHAWSALPVYYHQAMVLGVAPVAPGFREFSLRIFPGRFSQANGTIPTPYGPVSVTWEKQAGHLVIEAAGPAECRPRLSSYPGFPVASCTYNGTRLSGLDLAAPLERKRELTEAS